MTGWQWLFVAAVVTGWTVLYIWLRRRTKQTLLESANRQTLERSRARSAAITTLVMGAAFVVAMLLNWRRVPAGNEVVALAFIAFGLAGILYGAFRLYGLRR
jgi:uncharacterized membrane protein